MQLVPIGNSKGIRISKTHIEKYGFNRGVSVREEKNGIKITATPKSLRTGWGDFYKTNSSKMNIDYEFLDLDIGND